MPGRLFLTAAPGQIAAALGVAAPPADPPRRNIAPGQPVLCLTAQGWTRARWGLIPMGRRNARGRPVMDVIVNARSETVFDKSAFAGVRRAVVPAEGWYEWTGPPGRKTAWRIRPAQGMLAFAAIADDWTAPDGRVLAQVATVTCAPNPDVAPIHDRMGVLLGPAAIPLWLGGPEDQARALMVPAPAGSLIVAPAGDVDWTGP
jgi:putative SOS response-associated peptidase YedK